jgi:hypothetical protein
MGLFHSLLGNATEVSSAEIRQELTPLLTPNEAVDRCFKLVRDLIVFTDRRLILIDKQGVTGKKVEYHSLPYKFITHFSVETAGRFDLEAELKIWLSGSATPIQQAFAKGEKILEVHQLLATYVLTPPQSQHATHAVRPSA